MKNTAEKLLPVLPKPALAYRLHDFLRDNGWSVFYFYEETRYFVAFGGPGGNVRLTAEGPAPSWEHPTDAFINYEVIRTQADGTDELVMEESAYVDSVEGLAAFLETLEAEVV